jgi:hypothetical protein
MEQSTPPFRRYSILHHLILYPLLFILLVTCLLHMGDRAFRDIWLVLAGMVLSVALTAFIARQRYALRNQDRIIRLEMRLRYYVLTNKKLEAIEAQLTNKQLFSLRYASDEELPDLINRTITENLSPEKIRAAIIKWQHDHMRV